MNCNILLVAWRRPHTLRTVLAALRLLRPAKLFIACDGPIPGRPEEEWKVAATRSVIDQEINWPCHVERLYSDVHLGCRLGVSRAITWFFDHVDEGIILEDDCVPHPDFFAYCETLLHRYREDERVWCISGSNFQDGQWRGEGSYYFSHYNHCWGWASWKRCWDRFDANMTHWPELRDSGLLSTVFEDDEERIYWSQIWQMLLDKGQPDSWAYRWTFTCMANGGLTALPNRNLVSNIGFGPDGTHTIGSTISTPIAEGLGNLIHPPFVIRDTDADLYTFKSIFASSSLSALPIATRAKTKLRNYFHRLVSTKP